jgi:hypothetical protein
MYRFDVINFLIKVNGYQNYLEIGLDRGVCFCSIRCKHKTGVDPDFKIPFLRNIKSKIFYPYNIFSKVFKLESDHFFSDYGFKLYDKKSLDIALVDGLHTFDQSLKDIVNCLKVLSNDGIVVVHDCIPPHQEAAIQAKNIDEAKTKASEEWTGEWCGDVWKSMVYLNKYHQDDLNIRIISSDYGIGLIQKINDNEITINDEAKELISSVTYSDFERLINNQLQIIRPSEFMKIYG